MTYGAGFAAVYDSMYSDYTRKAAPQIAALFRRSISRKDPLVLDLCCGSGRVCEAIHEAGIGRSVGIDLSEAMLELARERSPNSLFIAGDVVDATSTIEFESEADGICCIFNSINELVYNNDLTDVLSMWRQLARSDAMLLIDFRVDIDGADAPLSTFVGQDSDTILASVVRRVGDPDCLEIINLGMTVSGENRGEAWGSHVYNRLISINQMGLALHAAGFEMLQLLAPDWQSDWTPTSNRAAIVARVS